MSDVDRPDGPVVFRSASAPPSTPRYPADAMERLETALLAAIALLPDADREAWRTALDGGEMKPGDTSAMVARIWPDGWIEWQHLERADLPVLRIHEKVVGGSPGR